jgi:hypothetical protein
VQPLDRFPAFYLITNTVELSTTREATNSAATRPFPSILIDNYNIITETYETIAQSLSVAH